MRPLRLDQVSSAVGTALRRKRARSPLIEERNSCGADLEAQLEELRADAVVASRREGTWRATRGQGAARGRERKWPGLGPFQARMEEFGRTAESADTRPLRRRRGGEGIVQNAFAARDGVGRGGERARARGRARRAAAGFADSGSCARAARVVDGGDDDRRSRPRRRRRGGPRGAPSAAPSFTTTRHCCL